MKLFVLSFLLFTQIAFGGLPPTTSKATGDSNNVVTFNFAFPNFAVTRSGITTTFGINSVAGGGTGLGSGTSGGIPYFNATSTMASSAPLTASQLLLGGGAGGAPTALAAGTQYQVLTMGASNPGYGAVNLAQSAAVTGVLPNGNTTAASANTASAIVARDGSGNFIAGTISANLTGTASLATAPATGTAHGAVTLDSSGNFKSVAPSTSGNGLISNGTDWASSPVLTNPLTTLGDFLYGGSSGTPTRLAGDITNTRHFLVSQGSGSVATAPTLSLISGSDLPNPSASTLGGIESLVATAHQWINTISASGVPSSTQPAFTDISGTATSSQVTTSTFIAPTTQTFTGPPTGATNYSFVISSHAFIIGDTYTNSAHTYTVLSASATSTLVIMSGTGTPAASGTLTWASGSGSGNITYSAFNSAYVLPSSPRAPLYIEVELSGGGGGGASGGTAAGSAAVDGTASTFGTSLLTANGGVHAGFNGGGGAGGTASSTSLGTVLTGGAGGGAAGYNASVAGVGGGMGGANPLGGAGGGGYYGGAGSAGATNTGGGGGGGGTTGATGPDIAGSGGGAGGYIRVYITSPSSLYQVTIGGGGAGGTTGTGNAEAGGAGAIGVAIVREHYQ